MLLLLHELLVTFCMRVTSYYLLDDGSYFLHRTTSYCLLHKLRVISVAQVTCYCLFHELRVTAYCTSCELPFACDFRLYFCMPVASYFLTMSYNTDEDDKIAYDNQVMIKNYSLRSFFDKELEVR